jgi:homoserine O-acetyltransferase
MARAFDLLRQHLGIRKIALSIGGSMGGQIVLSWAIIEPELFKRIVPVATNAFHSPWGIAFNEAQRMAIEADPSWLTRSPEAGLAGMRAARATAMLSYRHYIAFAQKQPDADHNKIDNYKAASYLQYMGKKIASRFDTFSYWVLSKAMDSHHVGRGYTSAQEALSRVSASAMVIGVNTDILFPPEEQTFIAEHIPHSRLEIIPSDYGHDGFLVETETIGALVKSFLEEAVMV